MGAARSGCRCGHVLLVSGRASFELVQKASMAGSRCSRRSPRRARWPWTWRQRSGLTLVGFLRGATMNVYARAERIAAVTPRHGKSLQRRRWQPGRDQVVEQLRQTVGRVLIEHPLQGEPGQRPLAAAPGREREQAGRPRTDIRLAPAHHVHPQCPVQSKFGQGAGDPGPGDVADRRRGEQDREPRHFVVGEPDSAALTVFRIHDRFEPGARQQSVHCALVRRVRQHREQAVVGSIEARRMATRASPPTGDT